MEEEKEFNWQNKEQEQQKLEVGCKQDYYLMRLEIDTDTEGADVKDAVVMRHIAVAY